MTSLIRELRSLVNPLRKPTTPADKTKGSVAGGSGTGGGVRTRGGATTGGGSSSTSPGGKSATSKGDNKSEKDDKVDAKAPKVEAKVAVKKSEEKEDERPKSPERKTVPLLPVPLIVLDRVDAVVKTKQDGDAKTPSETNLTKCSCQCVKRLEALEGEISDLKHWKAGRQELDDIISTWKEEVDKWMLSKFGFSVSLSTGSKGTEVKDRSTKSPEKSQKSELVTVLSPTSGNFVQEFVDENMEEESMEEDPISMDSPERLVVNDPFKLKDKETEHVEITPDINIFGHFLLENDQDEQDDPEEVILDDDDDNDDDDDDDDDQGEVAGPSVRTRRDRQIIKMRGDDEYNDTDSDPYTASEDSGDSDDDFSSEEDYMPENTRGRGRGRPTKTSSQASFTSTTMNAAKQQQKSAHKDSGLTPQTRKELLKQCKPRAGNLWECNVCGFMLASLENMMLHVKYNHSTSTHTCPFCRVVVLCRSPKDAAAHQRTCKMRPSGTDGKVKTPRYSFTPTPTPTSSSNSKPQVPFKKSKVEDINAKVNKFIEDILDPNSTTTQRLLGKTKNNSTRPPAVVTLSSDEDD